MFDHDLEMNLKEIECPECGERNYLESMEGDADYRCGHCGYEGNIQDDIDAQNYFWDEALFGYDEEDKGEVFDKSS